jgi:dihydrofolate reductase
VNTNLHFEFVGDLNTAIGTAKRAGGNQKVAVIGGASTTQQCLRDGLADELHFGIVPVIFGEGLRLLENLGDKPAELEVIQVLKSTRRTDIKYRVVR